ncbi:methyl-accepting chemotaxis protein [Pseudomonas sp.]|uniref:methyl-accepting chemotaxis protein n=1 Tax=Pseudomonas sp. TaxID=306 RepID=UPI002B5E57CA|nr:methyl-accepting chemotaxis protein [Pseudomonas sp.]HUE94629.1 methyl-accepting chemotaxis protein [Pseudomonas sp.]
MMSKLANLSISSKLLLAFSLLIAGFAAMLLFSLQRFVQLQEIEAADFTRRYERVNEVKDLVINIQAQRIALQLAMDSDGAAQREYLADIHRRSQANERLLEELSRNRITDNEVRVLVEQLQKLYAAYNQSRDSDVIPLLRSGQGEEARRLFSGIQNERVEQIAGLSEQLSALTIARVQQGLEKTTQELQQQRRQLLQVGLLLAVLASLFGWWLSRHIAQPLVRLTGWAERISRGEIPRDMSTTARQDEVGRLGQAFTRMGLYLQDLVRKAEGLADGQLQVDLQGVAESDVLGSAFATMVDNLRELVQEMNDGISVLASSSEEILAATSQVASSTQETATAISEIATTVAEVKQTAVLAGSKSQGVSESAARTRQVAQTGRQAVDEALSGMQQIREQMQAVAESIMRLGEQSQAIGEIVASVGDLAEQSNLLGVNASIEAVKAGETGKGFSVVAQEVKILAEQSKQATAQVRGILGEIQKAMTKAVLLAEQGSKTVEVGYLRAQASGEAIRTLSSNIEESSEMALQIAVTSQQQMVGMDQVATAMESIRQASQDNVGGTRQVDLAARNLHQLGLKLKSLAGRFKL